MSKSDRNYNDSSGDYLFYLLGIGILILGIIIGLNFLFKYPAHNWLMYTYALLEKYPFLRLLASEENYQNLLREYQISKFIVPEKRAIKQINVIYSYYLWLVIPISVFLLSRANRATMAATYTQKINSLEAIVAIKEEQFPAIKAGFQVGSAITKNQDLARFGKHSQEYGPLRWAIFNGILTLNGSVCFFKGYLPADLKGSQNTVELDDDFEKLKQLQGKFDYNANRLHSVLLTQIGKPLKHYTQLADHQIALCNMFLLFSKGRKFKVEAQSLRDKYARSFTIQNIGTNKEKVKFVFNRKSEIKKLSSLMKQCPDKMVRTSAYDRMFVLSCFAKAKIDGADITTAEFVWVKAIDRELFLLLSSYTGNPARLKNNGFAEVYAGLTHWLNIFELVSLDKKNNTTEADGFYKSTSNGQSLLLKQILNEKFFIQENSIKLSIGLTKKEENDINSISKAFNTKGGAVDFRDSIEKNKRFSKYNDHPKFKNKNDHNLLSKYSYTDFSEMCMAIFFMRLESCRKNSNSDAVSLNTINSFCKNYYWVKYVDNRFYMRCIVALMIMWNTGLSFKQICMSEIKSKESMKVQKAILDFLPGYELRENKIVSISDKDNSYSNLLDGWALLSLYKISCIKTKYNSHELNMLISDPSHSIKKSMLAFRYYMTSFEKWLRPEYLISLESFLGDHSKLSDISMVD